MRSERGWENAVKPIQALTTYVLLLASLGGCSTADHKNEVAEQLALDGRTTSRYHFLAENPFGHGLMTEGYLIGIEKSPKALLGIDDHDRLAGYRRRFRLIEAQDSETARARAQHLLKVLDDEKSMFVSHIIAYEPDAAERSSAAFRGHPAQNRLRTRFLYNVHPAAYGGRRYSPYSEVPLVDVEPSQPYESGWQALETSLKQEIAAKLRAARAAGSPYTHLVIGSMGWDNDQLEALERYNAILGNINDAALRDVDSPVRFKPLFIGITWPSVWGYASILDLWQLVKKLAGYPTKADDADEVGYTIGNWLVNNLAMQMRREFGASGRTLKVIAFGHSFGARLISRAVYSGDLLANGPPYPDEKVDLLLGLQGAFSANRFIAGVGEEGSPYAEYRQLGTAVAMTWSKNDTANPLAFLLSRSPHIGGYRGYEAALKQGSKVFLAVDDEQLKSSQCADLRDANKVLLVNATRFVHDHGDIRDSAMGQRMWMALDCVSRP